MVQSRYYLKLKNAIILPAMVRTFCFSSIVCNFQGWQRVIEDPYGDPSWKWIEGRNVSKAVLIDSVNNGELRLYKVEEVITVGEVIRLWDRT